MSSTPATRGQDLASVSSSARSAISGGSCLSGSKNARAVPHGACEAAARKEQPSAGSSGRPVNAASILGGLGHVKRAAEIALISGSGLIVGGTSPAHACRLWPFASRERRKGIPAGGPIRIMILMSDTGGGHRASAQALQAGFKQLYGDKYHIDVVDMATDHSPYPFNQASKSYNTMVKYPVLWRLGYGLTQPRIVHAPLQAAMRVITGRQVSEAYARYQPDLVVSVHPLMQGVPLRVLREREAKGLSDRINFATVVTDLSTCHNTWFHKGVDRCFVATEEAAARARHMGLRSEQIVVHGLPIRPAFSKAPPPRRKLRQKLGLREAEAAVLLVGGGEGMGPVEATVNSIARKCGPRIQLVVVCGRNERLIRRLSEKKYPEGMLVVLKGFVDNMDEWMNACDMIITKAGPGTIAEAFICGLPVLLNAFIPCQEEGNIDYVLQNKAGAFSKDPERIAAIVEEWTGSGRAEFVAMGERAKALGTPGSLARIVRDLAELAKHPTVIADRRRADRAAASAGLTPALV